MLCFRLLNEDEPAAPLAAAVDALRQGQPAGNVFDVDPASFRQVPNAPFAYWVSERMRKIFTELPAFGEDGRTVRQGLATADDFRFVRAAWEAPANESTPSTKRWFHFSKGGAFSPFYADLFLKVNWAHNGHEIRHFGDPRGVKPRSRPQSTEFYFKSGYTYPLRTSRFSPQILPRGAVISVRGSGIYGDEDGAYLGILASEVFDVLLKLVLGRFAHPQFDMGDICITPVPEPSKIPDELKLIGKACWSKKRYSDTGNIASHAFYAPVLTRGKHTLGESIGLWEEVRESTRSYLDKAQRQIDDISYSIYGVGEDDREAIHEMLSRSDSTPSNDDEEAEDSDVDEGDAATTSDSSGFISQFLDYAVGCAFGRWDIRYATGAKAPPPEPDPFDPLPVCPPGMLQNTAGLPAAPAEVQIGRAHV
jgi:hypothetical protein